MREKNIIEDTGKKVNDSTETKEILMPPSPPIIGNTAGPYHPNLVKPYNEAHHIYRSLYRHTTTSL